MRGVAGVPRVLGGFVTPENERMKEVREERSKI